MQRQLEAAAHWTCSQGSQITQWRYVPTCLPKLPPRWQTRC